MFTCYSLREHPVFSALVCWFHIRIHNRQSQGSWQSLKYYRLSKPVGRFTKTSLFDSTTSRKASSWCLLSLSNRKNSHSFLRISRHIFPRVCARSTPLLRICKVNCDWSLTADVKEIYSRLGFADSFARRVELKRKLNRILSQTKFRVWTAAFFPRFFRQDAMYSATYSKSCS